MKSTRQYNIFDCNVRIGNSRTQKIAGCPEQIIKIMDRFGIARAICSHAWGFEYGAPISGNDLLLKSTVSLLERIERQAVVYPLMFESCGRLALFMKKNHIRSLKILIRKVGMFLNGDSYGDLFSFCQKKQVPVWFDAWDVDWQNLSWALKEFNRLCFVISNSRYDTFNLIFSLMKKRKNLYLDLSRFAVSTE